MISDDALIHLPAQGEAVGAVGDFQFQELSTRSEDSWIGAGDGMDIKRI